MLNENTSVDPVNVPPKFGDVLMLPDIPVLAGVIMALAQPFAELRETLGMPAWTPLLVAALGSLLTAFYHVRFRRKARGAEAWVVTPLVTLILFSGAVGANNMVDAARKGGSARVEQASDARRELEQLRGEFRLMQDALESERRLNQVLRAAVGAVAPSRPTSALPAPGIDPGSWLRGVADFLLAPAQAQSPAPAETPQDPRVAEALRAYEAEQRRLQAERDRLREEETRQGEDAAQQTAPAPLWKSW